MWKNKKNGVNLSAAWRSQRRLGFRREVNMELLAAARAAMGTVDEAPGGAPAGFLDAPPVVGELAILPSQALRSAGRKRH